MGIYMCEDMRSVYEAATNEQGIVYLVLTGVYAILEVYCIVETIRTCRTQKDVTKNYVLIAAHSCIHALFIRNLLYLPGGVLICYPAHIYSIMSTYFYILKHLILLTMLYQIVSILLDSYTIPARKRYFKYMIIAIGAVDLALFTLFFVIARAVDGEGKQSVPLDIFSILDALIIGIIFNYFLGYFKKFLKRMQKFVPGGGEYKATMILGLSVNCCFIARIIYKIIALIRHYTDGLAGFRQSPWYGLYMFAYYVLNEMFPCIMIFTTMKKGGKEHYMKLDVMFKINRK